MFEKVIVIFYGRKRGRLEEYRTSILFTKIEYSLCTSSVHDPSRSFELRRIVTRSFVFQVEKLVIGYAGAPSVMVEWDAKLKGRTAVIEFD